MTQDINDLVTHMQRVQAAQRDLKDLGVVWQMIESSAAISCPEESENILPTLIRTRERFDDLQVQLIQQMAGESRAALGDQLTAKAQCAIDILVRNLFERTADVGFLATDDVIRAFCGSSADVQQRERPRMVQRLREYQAKYSVYDDVLLLASGGEVLCRLDERVELSCSTDAIVAEALAAQGYVERFRQTDLSADTSPALLYAHRIQGPDGRPLGVLVLRFRFVDEMTYVFKGMEDERHEMALVLIDEAGQVIVSNDLAHVPVGARLWPLAEGQVALTSFAGREYLAVACAGSGYQGYSGPAWRAQAMVSLLTAFRSNESARSAGEHEVPLENEALNSINNNADEINRDLRRVVWNGQLMASTQHGSSRRLKAMLNQVNQASRRTRDRVGVAIKDLHRTSLTRARRQVVDLARLAADIMDRNLYERANDCRWWALSPALQRALAVPADEADPTPLNAVLDHINGLYTVYTRLVAFDTSGRIRGVSHSEDGQNLVGRTVDARWVDASRGLHDSQRYHVSPFEETPLHDQGSTYVYLAAVRGDEASHPWLGGIAIVFNAARELQAMLKDVMADRPGVAAFMDSHGLVLASTDPGLNAGLAAGLVGDEGLVVHDGVHYACARVRAGGYREFKTSDGYDNGVFALVGLRLGAAERRQSAYSDRPLSSRHAGAHAIEVAIFQVGPMRCALPTASLLEAVTPRGLVRVPLSMAPAIGLLEVLVEGQRQLVQVNCARAQLGVTYRPRSGDGVVLILRPAHDPSQLMGLWIDDVLAVLEVDRSLVHEAPPGFQAFMPWLLGVIDLEAQGAAGPEKVLVQLFDAARITGSATLDEALAHDIEAGLPTQHDTLEELLPTGAAP